MFCDPVLIKKMTATVVCILLLVVSGCGNEKEKIEKSKATVVVKMPDAEEGKVATKTFMSDSKEKSRVGETIGVEGIVTIPSLADKSKEFIEATFISARITYNRPGGQKSTVNSGHGYMKSMGNDKYRYQMEVRGPLNPGTYKMELKYESKVVAQKYIDVTK